MQDDDTPRGQRSSDPDVAEAMDELDDFLRTGTTTEREPETHQGRASRPSRPSVPEDIVQSYRNLELTPAATMEQVRASYRRLMRTYHPDKHTDDAEKQRVATEITQRLTESFVKIRQFRGEKR
jgi:DnaJ-class molecular chaperone